VGIRDSGGRAGLGLLAIACAVFAVNRRGEKLLAGIAAILGVTAIAVQVFWALIGAAILFVVVNARVC
jgi:hypothetical protein